MIEWKRIFDTHNGTITPNKTITESMLYTYPCPRTGGHTKYARIGNTTWNATATWEGYVEDWHNISFDKTVVLLAGESYNYTIRTGSYPQIIHETPFNAQEALLLAINSLTRTGGFIMTGYLPLD